MTTSEQSVLQLFFPENTCEWFDIVSAKRDDKLPLREQTVSIVFEEKNIPPSYDSTKRIHSKGFYDITISDFPIRGRKTLLTFRRRYWKIEGKKELLKRDIKLCFPGTQLEKEFALFLKADSRRAAIITGNNR
jgi:hypothetical protein